jgi:hypothetical protein
VRLDHLLSKELHCPAFGGLVLRAAGSFHVDHWLFGNTGPLDAGASRRFRRHASGTSELPWVRASLFRFEGVAPASRHHAGGAGARHPGPDRAASRRRWPRGGAPPHAPLENCIASTSIKYSQAKKGQRWMPWRQMPMKDVGGCEKPRGAADQALIRGYPNGETRLGSCPVTPA